MKIAVCDDDVELLNTINNYLADYDASLEYDLFSSPAELLDSVDKNFYSLIFLDVMMKPINGLEAAKRIKKIQDKTIIVFITSSNDYAVMGYEFAFRYLVKPLSYEKFENILTVAIKHINSKRITVVNDGKEYSVNIQDIVYCEVTAHYITVNMKDEKLTVRDSLTNIEKLLERHNFSRPHNSYLINLDYIDYVTTSKIKMKNGLVININRKKKEEFIKTFYQYLSE